MITPRITAVNPWEVLRYLGAGQGETPAELLETVRRCGAELQAAARPKAVWRFFDLKGTTLEGTNLALTGQDIQRHLTDCHQCVLMAATLGADVEQLLMHVQVSDMARALILDSCASAAVENLCDNLEADLRTQVEAEGCYLTDRFSPGYGDFSIEHQRDIARELDTARRLGLTVTESLMLAPMKSVTAVIGVSRREGCTASGCAACGKTDCEFRRQ